jgi:hypothetical protein
MKNKVIYAFHIFLVVAAAWGLGYRVARGQAGPPSAPQAPQAPVTAFTYQGSLKKSGSAVSGNCDFKFGLWNAQSLGTQLGVTQTLTSTVSSGLFSVKLNGGSEFGAVPFDGSPRWLAIAVRCPASSGSYSSLTPQELDAAPYALYGGAPRTFYYPHLQVQSLDLMAVDSDLRGFAGGFSDGRYGYFVPNFQGNFGKVARVDLQNFAAGGVTELDLTTVDGDLKGFAGGFSDGRYGYFVPNHNGSYFGKVARVDLQNFVSGGVTVLDLTTVDSDLKGFHGGFTDGRYGYFVPYAIAIGNYSGKVARVDLQNFVSGGVTVLDLTTVDRSLKGFWGGFTDGRYGYFVPDYYGKVARVDLQNFAAGGVTALDLATVDSALKGFFGGFSDGRYGYFVPYSYGKVARVDLQNFTAGGVTALDLTAVDSGLKGFIGGFTDGRYGYFVGNNSYSAGKVARVDLQNFAAGGVTALDLATVDSALKGFFGGFSDGRYGYFVPYRNGSDYIGKVARIPLFFGGGAP